MDEGRPEPLPTPAELGHRLRGHRTGPPRLRAGGPRAARLFEHQPKTGQVPRIVFNPGAPPESYLRGPVHWVSAGFFPDARPYTSALCQPPTMPSGGSGSGRPSRGWREDGARPSARDLPGAPEVAPLPGYRPRPGGLGARDHLPPVGERHEQLPPLGCAATGGRGRRDATLGPPGLGHVDDPSERPTDEVYARYTWLVEVQRRSLQRGPDLALSSFSGQECALQPHPGGGQRGAVKDLRDRGRGRSGAARSPPG